MGVKSTINLTRSAAEERLAELFVKDDKTARRDKVIRQLDAVRPEGGFDMPCIADDMIVEAYIYVEGLLNPPTAGIAASLIQFMSNEQIEDSLEVLNDRVNGGEGFENYVIDEEDD